jgi:hypothetical protein
MRDISKAKKMAEIPNMTTASTVITMVVTVLSLRELW